MVLQLKNQIKNIRKSLSCSVKPYLTVCYDEQNKMRQKGDTQMTRNQIEYQKNVEAQRSNMAREEETKRANLRAEELARLRDAEQARANRAVEAIRSNELAETQRSNLAREQETNRSNLARELETNRSNLARELETNRSNLAREKEDRQWHKAQAQVQAFNAKETQRSNAAREEETNRSNLAKELETQRHNKEQERNASLNSQIDNARTERQYAAAKYQADLRAAIEREKLDQEMTYKYAALGIDSGFKVLNHINPFKSKVNIRRK